MEILSAEFLTALFAIIVIDLVLAGDNAIVIALAARSLPKHLQKQAIVWGAVGAIAVRVVLTIVVVWLLSIPGLMFVGGALLIWIAYKLLLPEEAGNGEGKIKAANGFWGAMSTIVVADMVMGLDNVLAVAGAAHGNYLLVVLGLLISIPIVVWGSSLLLGFVERFPAIVYLGAGVLAWTSAKMISSEPYLKDAFAANGAAAALLYLAAIGGVLWAGFVANHRRLESRITAHLARLAQRPVLRQPSSQVTTAGGHAMTKVLIPIDGSANSLKALEHAVNRFKGNKPIEIHLLHVRNPLSQHLARFVSWRTRSAYHRKEAEKALAAARAMLEKLGVPYAAHVEFGDKARTIHDAARRLGVDQILIGTARKSTIARMLMDSVTHRLLEITHVPVEVVVGKSVSKFERYGVPAGLGAALALGIAAAVA